MYNAVVLNVGENEYINTQKNWALHELAFEPMIKFVVDATGDATKQFVINNDDSQIIEYFEQSAEFNESLSLVNSLKQLRNLILDIDDCLIITTEFPLVTNETIASAYDFYKKNCCSCTFFSDGNRDNSDVFFVNTKIFVDFLDHLSSENFDKSEFINFLNDKKYSIEYYQVNDVTDLFRVSDIIRLTNAQSVINKRIINKHLLNGVTFISPDSAYIGNDVVIEKDTIIMPNTIIRGKTKIGKGCIIGPNSQITDSVISDSVEFNSSVILDSFVGEKTKVGPFAYIRPGSKIGSNIKIGDFVEIKNSVIGNNTKVSHLTYVGDADVGENVNFGCGTVLVNYDGKNKHRSTIENNAFIGCNTNIVSPVNIKENAFIAAGSTITEDVPEDSLAIARARQVNKPEWKRKSK